MLMKKLKAMVVDDSKVMRLMVMKSLRQTNLADFEFEEAEDGAVALGKFKESPADIMFVDWNMPNMSGIELVHELRKDSNHPKVPIVMVTSEKTMGKIEEAMDSAGANGYICKPFTVEQLQQKLGKIIDETEPVSSKGGKGLFGKLMGG
jgi:two-component system chemotaxis response regulator CheY